MRPLDNLTAHNVSNGAYGHVVQAGADGPLDIPEGFYVGCLIARGGDVVVTTTLVDDVEGDPLAGVTLEAASPQPGVYATVNKVSGTGVLIGFLAPLSETP